MSENDQFKSLVIDAKEIVKNYKLGSVNHLALNKVSLQVQKGELLAIAGTSGSGKTTLLNILGGIDRPDIGSVQLGGTEITRLSDNELANFRAQKLGFVFQTFNLIPTLSAVENVEYPLMLLGFDGKKRREMASKALEEVGLGRLKNNWPSAMSGGQRQRVAIARAIVKTPSLVFADEPTASLDKATAGEILSLMKKLNEEHGITFVVSSHDHLVLTQMKRVFHMSDGKQVVAPTTHAAEVANVA